MHTHIHTRVRVHMRACLLITVTLDNTSHVMSGAGRATRTVSRPPCTVSYWADWC